MKLTERLLMIVMCAAVLLTIAYGWPALTRTELGWSDRPTSLTWRQAEIIRVRGDAQVCRAQLDGGRWPVAQNVVTGGVLYRHWVLDRWRTRLAGCRAEITRLNSNPEAAIRAVFGPDADEAIAVSSCETGGTFATYAANGQYLGLFQMGQNERAMYGHGSTPLEQARAAHRYFIASGRDWSPWSCKP